MTVPSASSQLLSQSKVRLGIVVSVFMIGYLAVGLRLTDLTLLQSKPKVQETSKYDVRPLKNPLRAEIVDRNGDLVATSLKMNSIYVDTTILNDVKSVAGSLLKIIPDLKRASLVKKLSSGRKFVWIKRDVTPKQAYAINALGEPALGFQEEDRRIYPTGSLLSHLVGYTNVDGDGLSGIERSFDSKLKEGAGQVQLSIDVRVQHMMRRALAKVIKKYKAKSGVGVVMDVNTGEILSMVSLPDFDPYHPGDAPANARMNRGSLGVYEMGSTFKLFSTAAVLDKGGVYFGTKFDASEPIKYGRFKIKDFHAKKRALTVPEVFIYSSNIGAARMAMTVGTPEMEKFYKSLGLFSAAPLEISEVGRPLYPKKWKDIHALTSSFGHGIAVSPVQLVRAGAALVNGGILVTPTLLKPQKVQLSPVPKGARVVKEKTSLKIRQLMALNVAIGSGKNAYVAGYNVGGKTGTAEKNKNGKYVRNLLLSSFLGVFPVRDPRYVVFAMIDEPTPRKKWDSVTGGATAAPVVNEVISQMGPLYRMPPSLDGRPALMKRMVRYLKKEKGKSFAFIGAH